MDAQQVLFGELKDLIGKEYTVIDDSLPPLGGKFPIVMMGDMYQYDRMSKGRTEYMVRVVQNIHIWHRSDNRGTFSGICDYVKECCREIEWAELEYSYTMKDLTLKILMDNSSPKQLIHGIITVEYYAS